MHELTIQELPQALWSLINDLCRVPVDAVRVLPRAELPEPSRGMLVHRRDMTSTLVAYHGSALRVEVLQQRETENLYLREVFLRAVGSNQVVEYGVIAMDLAQFTDSQQQVIRAGRMPLGGVLHRFDIPFESTPIAFFSVNTSDLPKLHQAALHGPVCYGRFNQLSKPGGEPLARILEILPSVDPPHAPLPTPEARQAARMLARRHPPDERAQDGREPHRTLS
jgi:hypothetical protein